MVHSSALRYILGWFVLQAGSLLRADSTVIDEDFSDSSAFTVNGSAEVVDEALQLTGKTKEASAVWFGTPLTASQFTATFDFTVGRPGGISWADGFTFSVIDAEVDGDRSLGEGGEYLGYGSSYGTALSGFAVEFDTYRNQRQSDHAVPHVGLNVGGSVTSRAVSGKLPFDIRGAGVVSVEVAYNQGEIRVTLGQGDGPRSTVLNVTLPDETMRPMVGRVGFTGATHTGSECAVIDNFRLTIKPSPRVFAFFFTGKGGAATSSGMEKLRNRILQDQELSRKIIPSILGWSFTADKVAFSGKKQFEVAKEHVETFLRSHAYDPGSDRIIIIGHSYGGNIAYLLSSDVRPRVDGNDAASALITLDPIDWRLPGDSDRHLPAPIGVQMDNIRNFVQRSVRDLSRGAIGYIIDGADNNFLLGCGKDGRWGTLMNPSPDDTTHALIDDDLGQNNQRLGIYDAVFDFLQALIGE